MLSDCLPLCLSSPSSIYGIGRRIATFFCSNSLWQWQLAVAAAAALPTQLLVRLPLHKRKRLDIVKVRKWRATISSQFGPFSVFVTRGIHSKNNQQQQQPTIDDVARSAG
jgi:hypothetical protein